MQCWEEATKLVGIGPVKDTGQEMSEIFIKVGREKARRGHILWALDLEKKAKELAGVIGFSEPSLSTAEKSEAGVICIIDAKGYARDGATNLAVRLWKSVVMLIGIESAKEIEQQISEILR